MMFHGQPPRSHRLPFAYAAFGVGRLLWVWVFLGGGKWAGRFGVAFFGNLCCSNAANY